MSQANQVPGSPNGHTAAQLAAVLGLSKRAVQLRLKDIPPAGQRPTRGGRASAWSIEQLPEEWRSKLCRLARDGGFRDLNHLVGDDHRGGRWKLGVPFASIPETEQTRAAKLQRALMSSLTGRNDASISDGEFVAAGLRDYCAEFGSEVSERRWRYLLNRTVNRDGNREEWHRVELFVDGRIGALEKPVKPDADSTGEMAAIANVIHQFRDALAPSAEGLESLWVEVGRYWVAAEEAHRKIVRVRRRLIAFLSDALPTLAKNRESLRKLVDRKIRLWKAGNGKPESVGDRRHGNSGRPQRVTWSDEEERHIVAQSVLAGGAVALGIRRAINMGVLTRDLSNALSQSRKGTVPKRLLDKVLPIVRELHKEHAGSRRDQLAGPYVHGDWWSKEHPYYAGDEYVFDDLTGNVYCWTEDDGPPRLLLGQFLAGCDGRSIRLFPGAVVPSNVYHQLACRTSMNGMVQQFGIPRHGFVLENGLWKSAQLIKGQSIKSMKHLARDVPEFTSALGNLGIKIRHTEPRNPRGKIIERVFGLIQPRLESLKGYAGRLQLLDMPESTRKAVAEVTSGRAHPSKYFLSFEQMIAEYRAICEEYNAEPQAGEILRGMSPNQAWVELQNPGEPLGRLDPKLSHCFAHEKFAVRVRKYQLRIPISGHYYYRTEEIWKLNDTAVLAWFDPLRPESVIITDLKENDPMIAERISKVPKFIDGPNPQLANERAVCRSITKHRRATLVSLNTELSIPYRGHLVDAQTVAKAEQGEEFDRLRDESSERKVKSRRINQQLSRIGLPPTSGDGATDEREEAVARLARDMQELQRTKERADS